VTDVPDTGTGTGSGRGMFGMETGQLALLMLLLLGAFAAFGGLVRQTRGQRD